MRKCKKCGIETNSKFCPDCGIETEEITQEQQPKQGICPNCGIKVESKFCPECGAPVNADAAPSMINVVEEKSTDEKPVKVKGKMSKKKKIIIGIAVAVVLLMVIGGSSPDDTSTTAGTETGTESSYEDTDYEDTDYTEEDYEAEETEMTEEEEAKEIRKNAKNYDTKSCKTIAYDKLARNPDNYIMEEIKISGQVIQVMEGDENDNQLRVAVNGDYDTVMYVEYDSRIRDSRILEDDYVTVYGSSLGTITYQSTLGGNITIPAMLAGKIVLN